MSASGFLTKVFILYSIIPLNKWYMNSLWGVGQGLFQAAADTKRSADAAAQKAKTTATNTALGGVMGASAYKNAYQSAALGDKVTAAPGMGGQAGAINATGGAAGNGMSGIEKYKGALQADKKSVATAGIAGAAMGALGVNPRMAAGIIGGKGAAAYDRRVGSTKEERAIAERQMAIDRANEQNYGSKGYNADPQRVWFKKNADGTIDRSSLTNQDKSGVDGYSAGTYLPLDNNAAISSEENQDLLKNRLDSGIETGNHFIGAEEIKDADNKSVNLSSGVLVEDGSRIADANRIVDSEKQQALRQEEYQTQENERQLDYDRSQGLDSANAVNGYAKVDKKGKPIANTFTAQRPENIDGYMAVTKTPISQSLATESNRRALSSVNMAGNSSDGSAMYTVEGFNKASATKAIDNFKKTTDKETEYGYDSSSTKEMFAPVDSETGKVDYSNLVDTIPEGANPNEYQRFTDYTVDPNGSLTDKQIETAANRINKEDGHSNASSYYEPKFVYVPKNEQLTEESINKNGLDWENRTDVYGGKQNGRFATSDTPGKGTGAQYWKIPVKEDSEYHRISLKKDFSKNFGDRVHIEGSTHVVQRTGSKMNDMNKLIHERSEKPSGSSENNNNQNNSNGNRNGNRYRKKKK